MGSRALLDLEPENSDASTYSLPGNANLRFSYSVESDAIGNITYIDGIEIEWDGRRAVGVQQGDNTITYEYNIDGQRTKKTVNGVTTEYFYNGDILAGQKTGNDTIIFMYDNNGDIFGFEYNGTPYYYVKNAQNDVVMVLNCNDRTAVVYQYDAWGNITYVYDSTTQRVSNINPITYRSYYYDIEMGVYYLNSRYYAPIICRFISGDSVEFLGINGDLASYNLFAYCGNNPIIREDANGGFWTAVGIMTVGGIIGATISAISSAATQKSLTGTVNWKSVGVAAVAGFVSGAIAASPLGIVGQQIAGAAIGGLSYATDCYVNDREMKLDEAILSVGMGLVSGRIGGAGANENMVLSNTFKSAKQTVIRESRRANQAYAQKTIARTVSYCRNVFSSATWNSSFRFSCGTGISNGVTLKYSSLGMFPNVPKWKLW